jgi:RHS repeat-associated protein
MTGGGGGGLPGEGKSGGGMSGGGVINTLNGNMMKPYTLVSWPSIGELDIAFTVYYNSDTDYSLELGNGWSFTYGAKLEIVQTGQQGVEDIAIRWGDGSVYVFEDTGSTWDAPPGCFDTLTLLGSGNYQVTTPDLMEFEFTPPNGSFNGDLGDLVEIRDRNGNQITVTISTVSTGGGNVQRATKVEDAVTSRYIDIDYDGDGRIEDITDHTSRVWTFNYNFSDLEEIEYPAVNTVSYSRFFVINGWKMDGETDLRGEDWAYTYDGSGRVATVTDPLLKTTSYDYNTADTVITHPDTKETVHYYSDGLMSCEEDESNFTTNYVEYSTDRLATVIEDKNEQTWNFNYNTKGNILTATDPLSHTTTYTYEANGNDINTVTNHLSEVWDYDYYTTGAKNLYTVEDPKGRILATYDYNAAGDVDTITDGDSEVTTIAYGGDGYPDSISDPYSNDTNVQFDSLGRVTWVEDGAQALTGSADDRTDISYDEWGRQETITHPKHDLLGMDPRYTTVFSYDAEDNVLSVENENDKTVTFEYDAAGRLTDVYNEKNEHEEYVRNDRGWVTQVINGRGKSRYYVYTDRGDLYYYRFHLGGSNYEGEVFSYDGNGNSTAHSYYQWTLLFNTAETKAYEYDDANRLTEIDYATGSMTNVTFDYDAVDRVTEMVDATGTTTWDYWDDGQVKEMASPQGTMLYDYYSTTGRLQYLTEVVTGGNIVTTYTYDDAGRTETVDKFGETTTFEYDEASRPEKMIYDTGAYALYTYDGRSRIKAVEHKNSSHTLLRKETNEYDPASRITSRYEGPATGGVTTTFGYDFAGQLTSESSSGYTASYAYDANGNRTNRTVNGVSETYTIDDADKLTKVAWSQGGANYEKVYSYHYSGRVTGITYKTNGVTTSSETLGWNKENRLISRGTDTYTYNGLNTRVAKSDGGGSFTNTRAGAHQTAPVLADGAANYLPGISEKRSGASTFLHSGIKNGLLQTNSSQSNTATNRYDAFGNILASTGTWKGPFAYGGKFGYQTDDVDMQLLGDRYYDPTIGRFLGRDAAKDGRNWYAYGGNNSIGNADPEGKGILVVVVIVGAAALTGLGIWAWNERGNDIAERGRRNQEAMGKMWEAPENADINEFDRRHGKHTRGFLFEVAELAAESARDQYVYGPMAKPAGEGGSFAMEVFKLVKEAIFGKN